MFFGNLRTQIVIATAFKTKQTNYSINSDAYLKSNATFVLDFIYHK